MYLLYTLAEACVISVVFWYTLPIIQSIVYWGTGRNRYQIEVPDAALARYTPDDYNLASQKKVRQSGYVSAVQIIFNKHIFWRINLTQIFSYYRGQLHGSCGNCLSVVLS